LIFLTVGQDLRFDRLVRAVDSWCRTRDRSDVFGQIGDPGSRGYRPTHFEWEDFLEPRDFQRRFEQADLVVAHAGMGSIITALTLAKPILIMPRRAALMEQRNDHQLATADRFATRTGVHVAIDESKVGPMIDKLTGRGSRVEVDAISQFAAPRLINAVRNFIHDRDDR